MLWESLSRNTQANLVGWAISVRICRLQSFWIMTVTPAHIRNTGGIIYRSIILCHFLTRLKKLTIAGTPGPMTITSQGHPRPRLLLRPQSRISADGGRECRWATNSMASNRSLVKRWSSQVSISRVTCLRIRAFSGLVARSGRPRGGYGSRVWRVGLVRIRWSIHGRRGSRRT